MASSPQQTVEQARIGLLGNSPLVLGRAGDLNGFPRPTDVLPDVEQIWPDYYNNVMRGDVDTYDGFETYVDTSRTFSDNNPPDQTLHQTGDVMNADSAVGMGAPLGGFVPTVFSPGEVPGATNVNPSTIEGGQAAYEVVRSFEDIGHGTGRNGSITTAHESSLQQILQGVSEMIWRSPSYSLGRWSPPQNLGPLP